MINNLRKYLVELIGTMILVFFGCGSVVAFSYYLTAQRLIAPMIFMVLLVALTFGLALTAVSAMFGHISGAHVNPAVTIAKLIDGDISVIDAICYIAAQIIGACAGIGLLTIIWNSTEVLGANMYDVNSALGAMVTPKVAFIVEMVLTFVFVLTVLSVTKKENKYSPLILGLTLTLVHIFGIPFTGTSVNPARSIAPAVFQGGDALKQLPLFIIAPLLGGIIAGLLYRFVLSPQKEDLAFADEIEEEMIEEKPKKKTTTKKSTSEAKEEVKKTTKKTTTKKTTKSDKEEKTK